MRLFGELVRSLLRGRDSEVEWLRERVSELQGIIVELRRAGYAAPPSAPVASVGALPERVALAIEDLAGGNRTLEAELVTFARAELAAGEDEEVVVAGLARGGLPEAIYE
jgi:hypothetical protein